MTERTKFRSRKLENNKPIKIYKWDMLPDTEESFFSRSVQQVATGVDKEEETEHHLKAIIESSEVHVLGSTFLTIPTPAVVENAKDYSNVYKSTAFKLPKNYIKTSATLEDISGLCVYNMDDEDVVFFAKLITNSQSEDFKESINEAQFETIFSFLEKGENNCSFDGLKNYLNEKQIEEYLPKIEHYWRDKRSKVINLIPQLKYEDIDKPGSDPYVCFRKRDLKGPSRRTRRSDNASMDKLKRLHRDISRLCHLTELSLERDKKKKEAMILEATMFDIIWEMKKWKEELNISLPAALPSARLISDAVFGKPFLKKKKFSENEPTNISAPSTKITIPVVSLSRVLRDYFEIKKKSLEAHSSLIARQFMSCNPAVENISSKPCYGVMTLVTTELSKLLKDEMGYVDESINELNESDPIVDNKDELIRDELQILSTSDFADLNSSNVAMSNYNQHYFITTASIIRPEIDFSSLISKIPLSSNQLVKQNTVMHPHQTINSLNNSNNKRSQSSPHNISRKRLKSESKTTLTPTKGASDSTVDSGSTTSSIKVKGRNATNSKSSRFVMDNTSGILPVTSSHSIEKSETPVSLPSSSVSSIKKFSPKARQNTPN